jgi:two-component system C4-dicarboxylate transport response regulator DctD
MPGSKVVLVDDDPDLRDAFREMLEFDGHTVAAFPSATAALEADVLAGAAVLLTDYRLRDELDGLGLVRLARQINPRLRSAIVTGSTNKRLQEEVEALPEVTLFLKPFDCTRMYGYISAGN